MNPIAVYETRLLYLLMFVVAAAVTYNFYVTLNALHAVLFIVIATALSVFGLFIFWNYFSKHGREKHKRLYQIRELPLSLLEQATDGVYMGEELDLKIPIYLPDAIRTRHVHILGATGSGKTESVILNFLRQDVKRGFGSIVIDAKGDNSFLESLNKWTPKERLKIFDLSDTNSACYNPLAAGSPLESAQRLFSSLIAYPVEYPDCIFRIVAGVFTAVMPSSVWNAAIGV